MIGRDWRFQSPFDELPRMMICRRPNNRASSDIARGPKLHSVDESRAIGICITSWAIGSDRSSPYQSVALSELDNPTPHRNGDRLGSICCTQLIHDVLDVHLYGFLADKELLGNLSVPVATRNLSENLYFAA